MKKEPTIYIEHIMDCIAKIREYTNGMNEEKFLANKLVQDAVIRNFEIIGEATPAVACILQATCFSCLRHISQNQNYKICQSH